MAVTEVALVHLTGDEVNAEIHDILEETQTALDGWKSTRYPPPALSREDRKAAKYQQVEDRTVLLITEQWDSPEAHWEWIRSEGNQSGMAKFMAFIDGNKPLTLFHVDADVFGTSGLFKCPVVGIRRFCVKTVLKSAFESKYQDLLESSGKLDSVYESGHGGGWRIEKEEEDTEEFVMLVGLKHAHDYSVCRESEEADLAELIALSQGPVDFAHYEKFA